MGQYHQRLPNMPYISSHYEPDFYILDEKYKNWVCIKCFIPVILKKQTSKKFGNSFPCKECFGERTVYTDTWRYSVDPFEKYFKN